MLTRNVVRAIQWAVRILTLGHVAILLHEFAHAFVALLNGDVVTDVVVGKGPLLFRFQHYGTIVEFRERGSAGHCMIFLTRGRPFRKFCVYMAGPIASWAWMMTLCFATAETPWFLIAFLSSCATVVIGSNNDSEQAAGALADALIELAKKRRSQVNPSPAASVNAA